MLGETLAIVGESGAGKSTLLKVITGLIAPQSGEILVDGEQVSARQAQKLFFLQSQGTSCLTPASCKISRCSIVITMRKSSCALMRPCAA